MSQKKIVAPSRGSNKTKTTQSGSSEASKTQSNRKFGANIKFKCKTARQKEYSNLIKEKEIIISCGPAGVGKSYVAIATAIELLQDPETSFQKILIVTPAVEAEENLGFLPGDVKEKMAPYLASSIDIVDKILGKETREFMEVNDLLMVEPLGFIRGKSIDNSILITEEAQNMSPSQMKTLLTRIGYNSKYIISGDLDQSDKYKKVEQSGLYDAMYRHNKISEIGFLQFDESDIVRNPLITKILNNYKEVDTTDDYLEKKELD
jgi:phosphate starvation-inducible PhoH-like protein